MIRIIGKYNVSITPSDTLNHKSGERLHQLFIDEFNDDDEQTQNRRRLYVKKSFDSVTAFHDLDEYTVKSLFAMPENTIITFTRRFPYEISTGT